MRGARSAVEVVVRQTRQQRLDVDHVLAHPGTHIVRFGGSQLQFLAGIRLRVRQRRRQQHDQQAPSKAMPASVFAVFDGTCG